MHQTRYSGERAAKALVADAAGVRGYFEQVFSVIASPKITINEQKSYQLSDTAVTTVTMDTVTGMRDGKDFLSVGRTTWVFAKHEGTWEIVHFHRSSMPK